MYLIHFCLWFVIFFSVYSSSYAERVTWRPRNINKRNVFNFGVHFKAGFKSYRFDIDIIKIEAVTTSWTGEQFI